MAVLVGGFPRKAGMQRADLMSKNAPIFVEQGKMLEQYADRNVKVSMTFNRIEFDIIKFGSSNFVCIEISPLLNHWSMLSDLLIYKI